MGKRMIVLKWLLKRNHNWSPSVIIDIGGCCWHEVMQVLQYLAPSIYDVRTNPRILLPPISFWHKDHLDIYLNIPRPLPCPLPFMLNWKHCPWQLGVRFPVSGSSIVIIVIVIMIIFYIGSVLSISSTGQRWFLSRSVWCSRVGLQ